MTKNLLTMTVLELYDGRNGDGASARLRRPHLSAAPTKVAVIQIQAALAATKEGQKAGGGARSQAVAAQERSGRQAVRDQGSAGPPAAGRQYALRQRQGRPDAQYRRQDQELQPAAGRRAGRARSRTAEAGECAGAEDDGRDRQVCAAERLRDCTRREQSKHAGALCFEHRRHHQGSNRSLRQDVVHADIVGDTGTFGTTCSASGSSSGPVSRTQTAGAANHIAGEETVSARPGPAT